MAHCARMPGAGFRAGFFFAFPALAPAEGSTLFAGVDFV